MLRNPTEATEFHEEFSGMQSVIAIIALKQAKMTRRSGWIIARFS